jgi:hypothetical protein
MGGAKTTEDWESRVQKAAAQLGWEAACGSFHRMNEAYWFEMAIPSGGEPVGIVSAKPLLLDEIFWEVQGVSAISKTRARHRLMSGVSGLPIPIAQVDMDATLPETAVSVLHERYLALEPHFQSLEDFDNVVSVHISILEKFQSTVLTWMIARGRIFEAEQVCRLDLGKSEEGFVPLGKRFTANVLDFLGFIEERGDHIALFNGSRLALFPGYQRSIEERLKLTLNVMDGKHSFEFDLWKRPDSADREVCDARWRTTGPQIRCSGGPDKFVIEIANSDLEDQVVALGHVKGDSSTMIAVLRGESVTNVPANEIFTQPEAIKLLAQFVDGESFVSDFSERVLPPVKRQEALTTSPDLVLHRQRLSPAKPSQPVDLVGEFADLAARLHAVGWTTHVSVERLLAQWVYFCGIGSYPLTVYDYTNELTGRDAIERVLGWAGDRARTYIHETIELLDKQFQSATFYDGGLAIGNFFNIQNRPGWWWHRRPSTGELSSYLDGVL